MEVFTEGTVTLTEPFDSPKYPLQSFFLFLFLNFT